MGKIAHPYNVKILSDSILVGAQHIGFCHRFEASECLAISLDHLFKHGLRPYPYIPVSVHGLIYDHLFKRLGVLCCMKDAVYVALEVSVVFLHLSYQFRKVHAFQSFHHCYPRTSIRTCAVIILRNMDRGYTVV